MAKKLNRRLSLVVPCKLLEALKQELLFLGVGSRIVSIESRDISNRSDFVRLITWQYCDRFAQGWVEPQQFEEETGILHFYLDRQSEGRWNVAIKDGAAINYNQLVSTALWDYFERQQAIAQIVADKANRCGELIRTGNFAELRELLLT